MPSLPLRQSFYKHLLKTQRTLPLQIKLFSFTKGLKKRSILLSVFCFWSNVMFFLTTETCVYFSWKPFFFDNQRVSHIKITILSCLFFASKSEFSTLCIWSNQMSLFMWKGVLKIWGKKKKIRVIFSGETELFNQKERMNTIWLLCEETL